MPKNGPFSINCKDKKRSGHYNSLNHLVFLSETEFVFCDVESRFPCSLIYITDFKLSVIEKSYESFNTMSNNRQLLGWELTRTRTEINYAAIKLHFL